MTSPQAPSGNRQIAWMHRHKILTGVGGMLALLLIVGLFSDPKPEKAADTAASEPSLSPGPTQVSESPEPTRTALVTLAATTSPQAVATRPVVPAPVPVRTTKAPQPKPAATTAPEPPAKSYANCTDLRKDYPGGVARPGAVNQGSATKKKPTYSQALYDANESKDRDKDGIACEA